MKIAAFTRDKHVYSRSANKTGLVVKKTEWQKTRSFVQKKYSSLLTYLTWGIKIVPDSFSLGVYMTSLFSLYECKRILCLGAGDAYMEYAMKKKDSQLQLIITDFDDELIKNLKPLMKEIGEVRVVDIKKANFRRFEKKVDTVFMAATFYVLSDTEAVDFFRRIKILKPQHIFIVAVAYLWPEDIIKYIISHYLGGNLIGKLRAFVTGKTLPKKLPGRFHGWTRSIGEFRKILDVEKTFKIKQVYRYKNNFHDHAILHIIPA